VVPVHEDVCAGDSLALEDGRGQDRVQAAQVAKFLPEHTNHSSPWAHETMFEQIEQFNFICNQKCTEKINFNFKRKHCKKDGCLPTENP
jgi:hypothetical protein